MSLTLRRFFEPKATVRYPEVKADIPPKFRGRLQLLYDEYGTLKCETCFQCAQACPIECIDMGGMDTKGRFHVHWGARRDLRRAARGIGAPPLRPDGPGPGVRPFRGSRRRPRRRHPRRFRRRPGAAPPDPRGDAGRLWLPARRRPEADQPGHRHVVRPDLRDGLVLRPPPLRAAGQRRPRPMAVAARRPGDAAFLAGLGASLGGRPGGDA